MTQTNTLSNGDRAILAHFEEGKNITTAYIKNKLTKKLKIPVGTLITKVRDMERRGLLTKPGRGLFQRAEGIAVADRSTNIQDFVEGQDKIEDENLHARQRSTPTVFEQLKFIRSEMEKEQVTTGYLRPNTVEMYKSMENTFMTILKFTDEVNAFDKTLE